MFSRFRRSTFTTVASISLVIKLWLTAEISIVPILEPQDSQNFLEHAKWIAFGHWFGPYDSLTLIKGPAFPVALALAREFGIAYPLFHQLFFFFASVCACVAIRPLVSDRRLLSLCFVVIFFDPDTFHQLSWLLFRSSIGSPLVLIVVACAVSWTLHRDVSGRAQWKWAVALGVSFSAFWLNREEGIWLVPVLAIVLFPLASRAFSDALGRNFERVLPLAVPVVIWAIAILTVCGLNGSIYGWATVTEVQSPEFVSAYASLARISHPPSDLRFPVPQSAREIAYRVSPAAAELRPYLETARGRGRNDQSCWGFQACGDLAGGWFLWALRQSAQDAGEYRSGADARAYYLRLADELDRACDDHRIACDRKRSTLAPPITRTEIPLLLENFRAGLFKMATWGTFGMNRFPENGAPPDLRDDYSFVTRSQAPDEDHVFLGWIVAPRAISIEVTSAGSVDSDATISFTPSPDVAHVLALRGVRSGAGFARFTVTGCQVRCGLRITRSDARMRDVALEAGVADVSDRDLAYHFEADEAPSDVAATAPLKIGILHAIVAIYQSFFGWTALVAVIVLVKDGVWPRTAEGSDRFLFGVALLVGMITLMGILTLVQTLSFPGFSLEYFGAAHAVLLLFTAIVLARPYNSGAKY